jgi:aldose sugar dehydrogenase
METRPLHPGVKRIGTLAAGIALSLAGAITHAQTADPVVTDPALAVRTAVGGLSQPIGIVFLAARDWLVIEKNTGRVKRIVNGVVQSTVLDLAVNHASERGLLGIALHPQFASNHFVYLYWTCRAAAPPDSNPYVPTARRCASNPARGADSNQVLAVPLLGNRVDRFVWNGSALVFNRHLIDLRAFQNDGAPTPTGQGDARQNAAGNHDGGVLRFGPDGKLYIQMGDNGRRGQLQNLPSGPTLTGLGPTVPDDQFGGPAPDDAHFTGVIIRLNPDGSTPSDNPFIAAGAAIGGEAGANVRRLFAYGVRNGFGLAFDPYSGNLWDEQNGDDSFDELNRVTRGANLGWIQIMGPSARIDQYKQIERTAGGGTLQQLRWGPDRIADSPTQAMSRLLMLQGSHYDQPEFAWKVAVAPAGIGFQRGDRLGAEYRGNLFVGFARPSPMGGPLFRFRLTADRQRIAVDDPRLGDRVVDDDDESASLRFGANFGVVTDIQTGPNGNLYVVSLDKGRVFEIFRR